jgi:hypothetical protein
MALPCNLLDKIADGDVFHPDNGVKTVPETVFEADAGPSLVQDYGSFPTGVEFHFQIFHF